MNKTGFTRQYSKIIKESPNNRPISKTNQDFLLPFLIQSSLYGKKASREGIQIIPRNRKYGPKTQKFLTLVEPDGKELVIGKAKLIDNLFPKKAKKDPEKTHREKVLRTCRHIIQPQIADFRTNYKERVRNLSEQGNQFLLDVITRCALSGKKLIACRTAVDHVIPFIQLVDQWMEKEGLTFSDIRVKGKTMTLADSWFQYHLDNAGLQMVCSRANSSAGSKSYQPNTF